MSRRELEEIEEKVSCCFYHFYRDLNELNYPTLIERYLIWEFDRLFDKYKERPQLKYNKKGNKTRLVFPPKLMTEDSKLKITKLMNTYHTEILIEDLENY